MNNKQGNDNNTREKAICPDCKKVYYSYDPAPADFDHSENAADMYEALCEHHITDCKVRVAQQF